jgi:hypothetical protein
MTRAPVHPEGTQVLNVSHTSSVPAEPDLRLRYGRRRPLPRAAVAGLVLAGVLVLVGGTVVVWGWWRAATPVTATVLGYQVVSDSRVDVRFHVLKDTGAQAVCRVVAKDRFANVVGSLDVPIPPGRAQTETDVQVVTTGRAVVGEVDSCQVVG